MLIAALAGMVLLAGCKKNNENGNGGSQNGDNAIFTATISQQNGSRTYIEPNADGSQGLIKWQSGDGIIVDNGQQSQSFALVSGADNVEGGFTTESDFVLTGDYVAAYPSSATINRASGTVNVNIPNLQDGTLSGGSNPMLAITGNTELPFKSLCGGLGVRLSGRNTQVSKVIVSSLSGEKLNGEFVVDYTAENPGVMTESTNVLEEQKVTVNCNVSINTTPSNTIYIALPVNALNGGFDVEVYDNTNKLILKKRTERNIAKVELNTIKMLNWTLAPEGGISGAFSVSATKKVFFAQGNLQYSNSGSHLIYPSTTPVSGTWKFADAQYESIGAPNTNISSTYNGWIDLFGWATSGHQIFIDNVTPLSDYYQPYHYLNNYTTAPDQRVGYGPLVPNSLTGPSYFLCDWGQYNAISNGGNWPGLWRTLIYPEWDYVCNDRTNESVSGIRYAKATIVLPDNISVKGAILLPDDWCPSIHPLVEPNNTVSEFSSNIISVADWNVMEAAGAIFLPACGYRYEENGTVLMKDEGLYGYYWSATPRTEDENHAYAMGFHGSYEYTNFGERQWGFSVRLARDVQ